ncbi:MAG: hypothetical protein IEMM0008_1861 [bacterium]|nr:MAG: hypothetical protein IEMM0008_1861 [bacterium]
MINRNNVSIRSGPSTKSKTLYTLHYSEAITILATGKEQTIRRWGRHKWYKVSYLVFKDVNGHKKTGNIDELDKQVKKTGWVFGAFLEPVEVKVK